jgi:hypothetical protein
MPSHVSYVPQFDGILLREFSIHHAVVLYYAAMF